MRGVAMGGSAMLRSVMAVTCPEAEGAAAMAGAFLLRQQGVILIAEHLVLCLEGLPGGSVGLGPGLRLGLNSWCEEGLTLSGRCFEGGDMGHHHMARAPPRQCSPARQPGDPWQLAIGATLSHGAHGRRMAPGWPQDGLGLTSCLLFSASYFFFRVCGAHHMVRGVWQG